MFKAVSPKLNITLMEEGILRFWKMRHIFEKTLSERQGCPEYVFFEGPPTANGKPGVHHVLARAFKDIFPRYKTMRDTMSADAVDGIPMACQWKSKWKRSLVLPINSRLKNYGIAKFNELCRESAFTYIQEWERLTDRIGYWVDLEDCLYHIYKSIHRIRLVDIKEFLGERLALPGFQGCSLLPTMRNTACPTMK